MRRQGEDAAAAAGFLAAARAAKDDSVMAWACGGAWVHGRLQRLVVEVRLYGLCGFEDKVGAGLKWNGRERGVG
ncbi:hypothetical protein M0R45_029360 [Rubus argutus]|uniref:Uncharacterized protein n=1 Tax=Rubus argutus TaxID=59490 RepID=A0AAW1W9Y7_RUBAR